MSKTFLSLLLIATALLASDAWASASDPLIFRRDVITILPKGYVAKEAAETQAPAAPEPTVRQKEKKTDANGMKVIYDTNAPAKKANKKKTAKLRQPVKINTEMRSDQALKLDWIASLNRMREGEGVMILFNPPIDMPLLPMNVYDPVDVLFVDREGIITQIAPEISLYGLNEDVAAPKPVRAWYYLKGGDAERLGIQPTDRIAHPMFNPKPRLLQ